jgi:hypothetical protein
MALVNRRVVTVKKLFAALLEQGDQKGKSVMISPMNTEHVQALTAEQLDAYKESGSLDFDDVQVDEQAVPEPGQAFVDLSAHAARRPRGTPQPATKE